MKPLDSNDGAASAATSEPDDGGANVRMASSRVVVADEGMGGAAGSESDRGDAGRHAFDEGENMGANENGAAPAGTAASRVSRVVPVGTVGEDVERVERTPLDEDEGRGDGAGAGGAVRHSEVVPRNTVVREQRTPRVADFAATRMGPGFDPDPDDDEEATTVDAGAALTEQDREALAQRTRAAMVETRVLGTPLPGAVQPTDGAEAARDRRNAFKQTMLLGLPRLESPSPESELMTKATPRAVLVPVAQPERAAEAELAGDAERAPAPGSSAPSDPNAVTEPAVLASVVRVVGPPTHPPPRRSRRSAGTVVPEAPIEPSEPDHEAFVLRQPITAPDRANLRSRPSPPSAERVPPPLGVSVSRGSLPGVILPPAPTAADYELASAPRSSRPPLRATIEPPRTSLRPTIEPPLSRTRPPLSRRMATEPPPLDELPRSDPFAGFVAPAPSLAQRWLVVIVVALAVVGLCSLAAIALGLLGKTG